MKWTLESIFAALVFYDCYSKQPREREIAHKSGFQFEMDGYGLTFYLYPKGRMAHVHRNGMCMLVIPDVLKSSADEVHRELSAVFAAEHIHDV